jgi:hypothetical protein
MEIVAKTNSAFLIQASESELKEIINAVTGKKPEKIEIGQKIPAIDYASTITKIKTLEDEYSFKQLTSYSRQFTSIVDELAQRVQAAKNISIE